MPGPLRSRIAGTVTIVCALAAWEVLARMLETRAESFPSPLRIGFEISASAAKLRQHGFFTFSNILSGFLLGISCSLPFAALLSRLRPLERALSPILFSPARILFPALFPLFFIWMGLGAAACVLVVFLLSFFAAGAGFLRGFSSLPPEMDDLSRTLGAGPTRFFILVRLPASLPCGFCGMKEAVTLALLGAVVVEFAEADRGLGYLMLSAAQRLETAAVLAALAVLLAGGLALRGGVALLEGLLLPRPMPLLPANGPCSVSSCPRISCR